MKQFIFQSFIFIIALTCSMMLTGCGDDDYAQFDDTPAPIPCYIFVKLVDKNGNNIIRSSESQPLPASLSLIKKDGLPFKSLRTYQEALEIAKEHPNSYNYPPFITTPGRVEFSIQEYEAGLIAFGIYDDEDGNIVLAWADGSKDSFELKFIQESTYIRFYTLYHNGQIVEAQEDGYYIVTIVK